MIVLKQYLQLEKMELLFITSIRFSLTKKNIWFYLRPTKESDQKLSEKELYLVDSGGQYKLEIYWRNIYL